MKIYEFRDNSICPGSVKMSNYMNSSRKTVK